MNSIVQHNISLKTYVPSFTTKTNIVLHGSFSRSKYSFTSDQANELCLTKKWNIMADKYAGHYIVGREGTVYACFDEDYWSNHTGPGKKFQDINRSTIAIFLVNELFLEKENGKYYAFGFKGLHNSLYKGPVFEYKFKSYDYWADYSAPQIAALVELLKDIGERQNIPMTMLQKSAGFVDDALKHAGIVSCSNLNKTAYSLPLPTWVLKELRTGGIELIS